MGVDEEKCSERLPRGVGVERRRLEHDGGDPVAEGPVQDVAVPGHPTAVRD